RGLKLRQYRNFQLLGEIFDGRHRRAAMGAEQEQLAVECPGFECPQYFCGLGADGRWPEDNEVRKMRVEHGAQCGDIRTFAMDKSKLFEGVCQESANVTLIIGDANARPDLSPAEGNDGFP